MAALFKKKKDIVLNTQPKEEMITCPSCGEEVVKSVVVKKKYICPHITQQMMKYVDSLNLEILSNNKRVKIKALFYYAQMSKY